MKTRILTGFAIALFVFLALFFLPHIFVSVLFVLIASIAVVEFFVALNFDYSPHASDLCWCELIMIVLASIIVVLYASNTEIAFVALLCVLVDSGGYTAGKIAGRKAHKVKLLRGISPNKSWEGYVASVLCSVLFGLLLYYPLRNALPKAAIYFCLFAWVPAILGDLFESKLKRALNISDSAEYAMLCNFKPLQILEKPIASHGGYLDRIDSFIFAIVAYEFFIELMPQP